MQTIKHHLAPGLYKLTVDGDAHGFNWDELYIDFNHPGNTHRRTGPWDFDPNSPALPVVPAYWVYLNGRKLGLWYFNRPSFRQVRAKRMKGEAQFWIEQEGDYEIRFEPYRALTIEWADVRFEPSPDDTLLETLSLKPAAQRGLQNLFNESRWQTLAKNLDDPNFPDRALLNEAFEWSLTYESHLALPMLAARHRIRRDDASLARTRAHIEQLLAAPTWGNPHEDGYGHNADMSCSYVMRDMSIALNFLHAELGPRLVRDILSRLEQQGDIFLERALLQHGYWGGSVVQDHGFTSFTNFTSTAYSLLGWLPRAEHWLQFCLPRMEKTWRALPPDGVVPTTSFHMVYLYIDKVVLFRELHRQATGEDVYERPALRNLPDYCLESYMAESGYFLHPSARSDLTMFMSGHAYFDQIARTFADGDAAWLAAECRHFIANQLTGEKDFSVYLGTIYAALLHEPVTVVPRPRSPRRLRWFQDSGVVVYRDDARGILFSSRCGAPNSRTSYQNVTNPCDRLILAHMDGNFAVARRGLPVIQTAEGGYSMRTELANVVLVDGKGQLGDDGFAMAYPDVLYKGQSIEEVKLDATTGVGYVRMQLAPAYEDLETYTREWFFEPDGRMRLVDTIKSRKAHRFTWLFHTYRRHTITDQFVIQNGDAKLELRSTTPLRHEIADTLTVWGAKTLQGDACCQHLAFETPEPVRTVQAGFELR